MKGGSFKTSFNCESIRERMTIGTVNTMEQSVSSAGLHSCSFWRFAWSLLSIVWLSRIAVATSIVWCCPGSCNLKSGCERVIQKEINNKKILTSRFQVKEIKKRLFCRAREMALRLHTFTPRNSSSSNICDSGQDSLSLSLSLSFSLHNTPRRETGHHWFLTTD
jgi:hypothetical protein